MRHALARLRRGLVGGWVDKLAWAACLALPLALLHARAVAEILIAVIDLLFVARIWARGGVRWRPLAFVWAAAAWWAWLVMCTLVDAGFLGRAVLAARLPLLALAVGAWLLPGAGGRRPRWLWGVLAAGFAWVGVECWQQYLTGHNLFGGARWGDGALTGPFNKPRAGPAFVLLFFPVVVPAAMALVAPGTRARVATGAALVALAALTMVLIGQRMPTALMGLGLVACAALLPRLRWAVLGAGLAGALLVAALPALSPATNDKLVVQTGEQMRHFAASDYGLIFARALGVVRAHPWTGLGFDGFRRACAAELAVPYVPGVLPPPNIRACNQHPHNYYLEAAVNAGWPGLASFAVMAGAALAALGRGLWRRPDPGRVGLFAGALVALWPAASTSAFTSMPNGGWVFLLLGAGFAACGGNAGGTPPLGAGGTRESTA